MGKGYTKMKVSRTFSLPVEAVELVRRYAEREEISESESCRRLIRAGADQMKGGKMVEEAPAA